MRRPRRGCASSRCAIIRRLISALTNDEGFAHIFSEQLRSLMRPRDLLIGISVHGGSGADRAGLWSQNLLRAMQVAKEEFQATVVGFSGFDGGAFRRRGRYLPHGAVPVHAAGGVLPPGAGAFDHILFEREDRHVHTSIKNQGVLITGGGRGIGKRLALGFAAAGARVGLLARSKAELDLAKLEIEHAGGTALRFRADVRDLEQICAAVDRMCVQFGSVDILIAAAGVAGADRPAGERQAAASLRTVWRSTSWAFCTPARRCCRA